MRLGLEALVRHVAYELLHLFAVQSRVHAKSDDDVNDPRQPITPQHNDLGRHIRLDSVFVESRTSRS